MSSAAPTDIVVLGERSYPVLVEEQAFDRAGELLKPYARGSRIVVVTDRNVFQAQGARFAAGLERGGISPDGIVIDPGEGSKDWSHLARLIDDLLARGVERGDHIVALGGGVVGDLTAFAASILKRGCGVIQVPTSLLAMVDSAIGGKTGINVTAGKNLVGTFHQPGLVLIDPACLDTLPERELRAGFAEVVKYGLIGDAAFFHWCDTRGAALLEGDDDARLRAIRTCVAAKAAIVAQDERDSTGQRALLNLGHSFAHALEAEAGFSDALLHGEAVAIGLTLAFHLSAVRGDCPVDDAVQVEQLLAGAGLPTRPRDAGVSISGAAFAQLMQGDKKVEEGVLPLILARGIGEAYVDRSVSVAELTAFLEGIQAKDG